MSYFYIAKSSSDKEEKESVIFIALVWQTDKKSNMHTV